MVKFHKIIHPHRTSTKHHIIIPSNKPVPLHHSIHHSRALGHQDKEKEEIMCHSRTLDRRDKEKEEIMRLSRTLDLQDREKEIMCHSRTLDLQDREKEILCHSKTLDHHSRTLVRQDKEKEEILCLVEVNGISNHHIWRNLNKLRRKNLLERYRRIEWSNI
jgi:hypothetical protein